MASRTRRGQPAAAGNRDTVVTLLGVIAEHQDLNQPGVTSTCSLRYLVVDSHPDKDFGAVDLDFRLVDGCLEMSLTLRLEEVL